MCSDTFPSTLTSDLSSLLQGGSYFSGTITATPVSPAYGLQLSSNGQQESRQDTGLSVVTTENCSTTTEGRGNLLSLEERTQGEYPAVVTHTSCTSGRFSQSQEPGEQRSTPAANPPAGRNRKNKKRTRKTTRRVTESAGNQSTPEASRGTAQRPTKTTGSGPKTEGTVSEPAVASVVSDGGATRTWCSPGTEETALPIKTGGDGTCGGRKAVALPTTTIIEKQEAEEWEVDMLMCEQPTETETVPVSPPARQELFTSALETATHKTGEFLRLLKNSQWSQHFLSNDKILLFFF